MRIRAVIAVSALVLAGCGDSTSPDASTFSFTYTGAGSANARPFSATGDVPPNLSASGTLGTSAWAAGAFDPASNFTFVAGVIPKSSTTYDFAAVGIARKTVGTSTIDSSCGLDVETTEECTGFLVFFGFQPDGDASDYDCFLTTGSVSITSVSDDRVAGTFSGAGTCFNGTTGFESPFSITNGAFNVGLSAQLLASEGAMSSRAAQPARRHLTAVAKRGFVRVR